MPNKSYIKSFLFNFAQYEISDERGDKVLLKIDYADNTFSVEARSTVLSPSFQRKLTRIAQDLLRRKRGVNFAERI